MKKFFTAILFFTVATFVQAQVEKNIVYRCAKGQLVYTEPVKQKESAGKTVANILGTVLEAAAGSNTTTKDYPEYAEAVKDAITGAVGSARRVRFIDGEFLPDELAEDEVALYVDAKISAIKVTSQIKVWQDDKKVNHELSQYRANITGNITIKQYRTDQVVYNHTINSSSWADSWFETPDKALGYAINTMKGNICRNLNNVFPLHASIVEGARSTESKAKEIYIDLGEQMGCQKGMHFDVYTVKIVAGKEAKKQIGQLKVTEVMGDEISLCKVQKGGADIKNALENGAALLITSKD